MPATRAAALSGELSQSHLRLSASCRTDAAAELFHGDEAQLVEWAKSVRLADFKRVVRVWGAHADPDDVTLGEPDTVKAGQLFLSESFNDCWILKGTLDPEQGRIVAAAVDTELGRLLRAKRDGDPTHAERLVSELRAEALVNVVAQTMRKEPSERSVPDRYRVAVLFNAGDNIDRVELCDSALYRAVKDTRGAVPDVSHATRVRTDPIRLAVTLRDEHCIFPGCDRPPSWCDVHHCQHWQHGGTTNINNGALLCRHHHTFIHKTKWSINIQPGHKPTIHKPDGTIHQIVKYHIETNRTALALKQGRDR